MAMLSEINIACLVLALTSSLPVSKHAAVTAPTAKGSCELRVFPTLEAEADTQTLMVGFGAFGAIADAAATKKQDANEGTYLREALSPPKQVKVLSNLDLAATLKLPSSNVIFETPLSDAKKSLKSKQKLTGSSASCYVELVITVNAYTKSPIYGRSLKNEFIIRDFRKDSTKALVYKGSGGTGLKVFPPETTYMTKEAENELQTAFAANVAEFAADIRK